MVPAYLGIPGQKAIKQVLFLLLFMHIGPPIPLATRSFKILKYKSADGCYLENKKL